MLCIYYIPVSNDNYVISAQSEILYDLLPFIILCTFWSDITEYDNQSNNMLDYFTFGDTNKCDTDQFYFTYEYPEILYWSKAYMKDNDTYIILKNIQKLKT